MRTDRTDKTTQPNDNAAPTGPRKRDFSDQGARSLQEARRRVADATADRPNKAKVVR